MKKIISIMLMCMFFAIFIVACKQDTTANIVAKNLDKNLNNLSTTVNKLDTIDNKYISNPDLYSSISTPTNNKDKFFALTFAKKANTDNEINDLVKQLLVNKIKQNLLNQNTTNNNDCYSCKKYCDNNGNCYYTDCNGNNYMCDTAGNCSTCPSIPGNCSYMGESNFSSCPNATPMSSQSQDDLLVEQLSLEQNIATSNNNNEHNNIDPSFNYTTLEMRDEEKPVVVGDDLDSSVTDTINPTDTTTDNTHNSQDSTNTNENPNVRVYYFTQESFTPPHLKYQPRYVNEYNENNINDQIETYLFKIQKLYAMTEDSIEANSILSECKKSVLDCIQEIKELNTSILNGNCEPSTQQLEALNNYISDIKITIGRLKNCNGELSKEVNDINSSTSSSLVSGVDVLNSRYLKLLNHIDTRITYHKSAIATLEQIKYLLDDAVKGNTINEEQIMNIVNNSQLQDEDKQQIKDIIEDINNSENSNNIVDDTNTNTSVNNDSIYDTNTNINDNNINVFDNNGTLDNMQENQKNSESFNNFTNENQNNTNNNENQINNYNDNQAEYIQETDTNISSETSTEDLDFNNTQGTLESTENNINSNDFYHENGTNLIDNNDDVVNENIDKESGKQTNIDTYDNSSLSNIDTYRDNITTEKNNTNIETNLDENNTNTSTDYSQNFTQNDNIIDSNSIANDSENYVNNGQILDTNSNEFGGNNIDNIKVNNNTNNDFESTNPLVNGTTLDNGFANSGMYQNSVITQNNLDTNNGFGGYYYTADGEIKNIGTDNNNLGNNGNTVETNLNGNNNVNTYGYNTLLDIINQGTVNNGINTL